MRYESEIELVDCSVGKLLLTVDVVADKTVLIGKMTRHESLSNDDVQRAERYIMRLSRSGKLPDDLVGLHKNMSFCGERLGGCNFVFFGGVLRLFGESGDFGPIDDDAVKKCLSNQSVNVERLKESW